MSDSSVVLRPGFMKAVVVLLLVVCAGQAYVMLQLRDRSTIEGLSPGLVQECLSHISSIVNSNLVSEDILAPRMLQDTQQHRAYVEAFPVDLYSVVPMAGPLMGARLYLDDIDDVIKNVIREGGVWEMSVVDMLLQHVRNGSTVLDIGAHIGAHTLYMSQLVGPAGRVYAFEPQKKIHRELVQNMRLNGVVNVVPLRFAAGSSNAIIEMNNDAVTTNEGGTSVGQGGDEAEMRTIDSFDFRNVSLIKIDVEGLEDEVLAGARETILREHPKLLIEIQGGYDPETAPDEIKERINATIENIGSMGYVLIKIGLYDYLALPGNSMTEFDLPRQKQVEVVN